MNIKRFTSLAAAHAMSLFFIVALAAVTGAQVPAKSEAPTPKASPAPSPTPSPEKKFFRNILGDQKAIWTSPLHISRDETKWLLPLGISTAALIATDRRTAGVLHDDRPRLNLSHAVSQLGSVYGAGGIAATFYLVGRRNGDARALETGILGGEALVDGWIVAAGLKAVSERRRPKSRREAGDFFDGGFSFPSGHAIAAWSLATVVANEYRDRPLIKISSYGLATLVSLSRFTGRNHFLSDVLVGSGIGYGIGHYVYHAHHDQALDSSSQAPQHTRLRQLPLITPIYERSVRNYGAAILWTF
jgi:membrane-associated phospholipid phosphatase